MCDGGETWAILGEMVLGEKVRCGLDCVLVPQVLDPGDDVPPLVLSRAARLPHGDEQVTICLLVPVLELAAGHLVMESRQTRRAGLFMFKKMDAAD